MRKPTTSYAKTKAQISFAVTGWNSLFSFTPTSFLYSYKLLPLLDKSTFSAIFSYKTFLLLSLCPLPLQLLSLVSSMSSASFAASLANLSAVSFPAMSACLGVQEMSILTPSCSICSIFLLVCLMVH